MKNILLSVETTTPHGSLNLYDLSNNKSLADISWEKQNSHSEVITSLFLELLEKAKLKKEDINVLALGIGPGSFTGIRVAVNFVKTLAFSLNLEIYAIDSLKILASQSNEKFIAVLTNAFRNLIYFSLYRNKDGQLISLQEPSALTLEEIIPLIKEPSLFLGSGFDIYKESLFEKIPSLILQDQGLKNHPQALDLSLFISKNLNNLKPKSWKNVQALYLRQSEAEEKLRRGLLKPITKLEQ